LAGASVILLTGAPSMPFVCIGSRFLSVADFLVFLAPIVSAARLFRFGVAKLSRIRKVADPKVARLEALARATAMACPR
jgi:hypothetical protein